MVPDYTIYKSLQNSKNYELIYEHLYKEIALIQDTTLDIKDISHVKSYIDKEIKDKIYKRFGIPTFVIKIIILLGEEYEYEVTNKLRNYLVTEYLTEFQLFMNKEFACLSDLRKYYIKINSILKEIDNKYFNLPPDWNIRDDILRDVFILVKQKICDIFYFNNFTNEEYITICGEMIDLEKSLIKNIKKDVFSKMSQMNGLSIDNDFNQISEAISDMPQEDICISESTEIMPYDLINDGKPLSNEIIIFSDDTYNSNESKMFSSKSEIFKIFVPFMNLYFEHILKDALDYDFHVEKSEMKIYKNFLLLFKKFEEIYEKIKFFENIESIHLLMNTLCNDILLLVDKIPVLHEYENENIWHYQKEDFLSILISLNTISYLNETIFELNRNFKTESYLKVELQKKLRSLENKFSNIQDIYIRNIISNNSYTHEDKLGVISKIICKALEENIFYVSLEEIFDDVKGNLLESIILQILSRIYLLDFDEEMAETMICDLSDLRNYLSQYFENISSFNIIESYLKIFMCSTKDKKTFIDNFNILSNQIFSFEQVIWSLKNKDNVCDLLEIFKTNKNIN